MVWCHEQDYEQDITFINHEILSEDGILACQFDTSWCTYQNFIGQEFEKNVEWRIWIRKWGFE